MSLFALVLVARLFFVQVVDGKAYEEQAENQYITSTQDSFNRGEIFFKEKDGQLVSAATLKSGFTVAINPTILKNPDSVYEKISAIYPIDKKIFTERALKTNDPYEEIGRRVPKDEAYKINDLGINGLSIHGEKWRFYPAQNLASHILGFVGFGANNKISGRYGLEKYYEGVLERSKSSLYVNFFAEIFSNITKAVLENDYEREGDLTLNIDPNVEAFLEKELNGVIQKWSSQSVGGIILDPKTGAVYALGALPNFNPNSFQEEKGTKIFSNPIVEDVFEMGSIIKPLVMAAALDAKVVTAETEYDDKGFVILNGRRIENFDHKSRGVSSMQRVLNESLNTGMVFVMQRLGREKFRDYMLSYGIDEETGIDLPNEIHGLTSNLESNRDIEYATASFGQGIATTPIETARALGALGNGGLLVTPQVVSEITYKVGPSKKIYPDEGKRVLKKETSEEITRMLVEVVDKALLGGTVKMANYSIAAKTGTAQIADTVNGGYYEDRFLHSFFGYFPAYNPRFLIFLYNVYPKEVKYASQTLTYPFMDIAKFLINYYEIPPDR